LELILKKGIVETEELKDIFDFDDHDLDKILEVLLMSGLVKLDRKTYLAPTPTARIFSQDEGEYEEKS